MYYRTMAALALLSSSFFINGCATIVTGTTQELSFQSNPDGALVTVNGREIGKTPITTTLKRGSAVPMTFSKPGYKTISMELASELNGWFWGDIVCLGFYGSTTDGVSGAMHKYAPDQYMVTLVQEGTNPIDEKTSQPGDQKITEFVVVSYRELIKDLRAGEGPYLSSLLSSLEIPTAERPATVSKLKALAEVYTQIPEFAQRVVDLRRNPAPAAPAQPSAPAPRAPKAYSGDQIEPMLEHAPAGLPMKVTIKSGQVFEGPFDQFTDDKLWLKSPPRSFQITKIKTVEVAQP
jgi:hypothetical protein